MSLKFIYFLLFVGFVYCQNAQTTNDQNTNKNNNTSIVESDNQSTNNATTNSTENNSTNSVETDNKNLENSTNNETTTTTTQIPTTESNNNTDSSTTNPNDETTSQNSTDSSKNNTTSEYTSNDSTNKDNSVMNSTQNNATESQNQQNTNDTTTQSPTTTTTTVTTMTQNSNDTLNRNNQQETETRDNGTTTTTQQPTTTSTTTQATTTTTKEPISTGPVLTPTLDVLPSGKILNLIPLDQNGDFLVWIQRDILYCTGVFINDATIITLESCLMPGQPTIITGHNGLLLRCDTNCTIVIGPNKNPNENIILIKVRNVDVSFKHTYNIKFLRIANILENNSNSYMYHLVSDVNLNHAELYVEKENTTDTLYYGRVRDAQTTNGTICDYKNPNSNPLITSLFFMRRIIGLLSYTLDGKCTGQSVIFVKIKPFIDWINDNKAIGAERWGMSF